MAKINVFGDALIITSALKAEDIKMAAKFRPESLVLKDENGDPYFAIGTTTGAGSINGVGVSFGGVSRDGQGLATVTLGFTGSNDPEKIKDEIADKFGIALTRLNQIEAALPEVLADIAAQKAAVVEAIEVE
jgi:hypothetical protein